MTDSTHLVCCFVDSPLGRLTLVAADAGLCGVYFPDHAHAPRLEARERADHAVLALARGELGEYFAGQRTRFATPLAPPPVRGGTAFQHAVWRALRAIPYGETRSYGELARALGRPGAARALGAANGLNPLSIFVPCHRVVGADGALTGYAGGLAAKRWLLAHEGARARGSVRP